MPAKAENGKGGAPPGNQNARKHGFYSKVLDEAEQLDFEQATRVEGLDDEIAVLRVRIKHVQSSPLPHGRGELILNPIRTLV